MALGDKGHGGHRAGDTPEKGELLPVHPGLELQGWVLPEGRHDEAEEQRDADEDGGEDDLRRPGEGESGLALPHPAPCPAPSPPRGPTCAKKPRVLRRAWSILLVKRARSWRQVSAQPLTLPQACPAAPRSRSVSRGSSAAGAQRGLPRGSWQAGRGGTGCGQGHPPNPKGMGCCVQEPPAPSPHSPQLLPRRAPLAQCKGEERGVTVTRGSAPTQGRAGAPNHHSPPDSHGCPHTSSPSRICWICPLGFHIPSCTELGSPKSILIPDFCFGDTPKLGGSCAVQRSLSIPLPEGTRA